MGLKIGKWDSYVYWPKRLCFFVVGFYFRIGGIEQNITMVFLVIANIAWFRCQYINFDKDLELILDS